MEVVSVMMHDAGQYNRNNGRCEVLEYNNQTFLADLIRFELLLV